MDEDKGIQAVGIPSREQEDCSPVRSSSSSSVCEEGAYIEPLRWYLSYVRRDEEVGSLQVVEEFSDEFDMEKRIAGLLLEFGDGFNAVVFYGKRIEVSQPKQTVSCTISYPDQAKSLVCPIP